MNKEDYSKYYIQGSDHYLIPKDEFKELFNEMSNWREEAKELKKQLEEYKGLFDMRDNILTQFLNDEVEIIEEPKKIEKIARCDDIKMTHYGELHKPTENEEILRIKVNELIDEINNLKDND